MQCVCVCKKHTAFKLDAVNVAKKARLAQGGLSQADSSGVSSDSGDQPMLVGDAKDEKSKAPAKLVVEPDQASAYVTLLLASSEAFPIGQINQLASGLCRISMRVRCVQVGVSAFLNWVLGAPESRN